VGCGCGAVGAGEAGAGAYITGGTVAAAGADGAGFVPAVGCAVVDGTAVVVDIAGDRAAVWARAVVELVDAPAAVVAGGDAATLGPPLPQPAITPIATAATERVLIVCTVSVRDASPAGSPRETIEYRGGAARRLPSG